jgi:integrative and conjugative element protein (TIGR02256 family)
MSSVPEFLIRNSLLNEGRILIEHTVWEKILPFRQKDACAPEAGGILLGYRRDHHLHVIDATLPQPEDHGSRFRFLRAKGPHQRMALSRWETSAKTIDYLGEWHTHPELAPSPSRHDTQEWRRIHSALEMPMLFLILGWSSTVWIGIGWGTRLLGASQPLITRPQWT